MSTNLNTTMNGTQPTNCLNPTAERIGKTFAYCLLFVISLVGNTSIGIIVYKTKTMRKPINFLIVNMAMSDFLLPIFLFPRIVTDLYVDSWLINGPLGQALCKLVIFLQDVSSAVSIQSLVLITVDRFGAVVFPLRSPLISSKLCPFFILATWIIAMAFFIPYLLVYKLVTYPPLLCVRQWTQVFGESSSERNYFMALYIISFYIPLVFISILYLTILLKLKSQKKPGEQSVNTEQQRKTRERNVLKMSIAIVLGFAVCWLPFSIINLIIMFANENNTSLSCGLIRLRDISILVSQTNSAINPCICFIFSGNYRQGLKNLLSYFSQVVPSPS